MSPRYKSPYKKKFKPLFSYEVIKRGFIFLSLIGLLLLVHNFFWESDLFTIKHIAVEGANGFVNKSDLQTLADASLLGKNIFQVDLAETQNQLISHFQGAKSITLRKNYPSTIDIDVVERVPLAVIKNKQDANTYLVDNEGYVLGIVGDSAFDLPHLNYEGNIKVGYFIDKRLVPLYLDLLTAVETNEVSASSVSITENYLSFYTGDNVNVLVGGDKDIPTAVKVLAELLRILQTEGQKVAKIDLRYDKVIVQYLETN